jgi:hypothetical protein
MKIYLSTILIVALCALGNAQQRNLAKSSLREVNKVAQPAATSVIALVGANLIDGRGGPVVPD